MERLKIVTYWMLLACLVVGMLAGCTTTTDASGKSVTTLDPNSPALLAGEAIVAAIGSILPIFGQVGALLATALIGALAAWQKVKPTLTKAKTEAEQYHAAAAASVLGIEEFKKLSPEAWGKLSELLTAQMGKVGLDPLIVENVIRGLRGLPPKG